MARQLRLLQGSRGLEKLIARIRRGDRAASSELFAASLCMAADLSAQVEFAVDVQVDKKPKNIDFRIS
jgi:hypothetical protein